MACGFPVRIYYVFYIFMCTCVCETFVECISGHNTTGLCNRFSLIQLARFQGFLSSACLQFFFAGGYSFY